MRERQKISVAGDDSSRGRNRLSGVASTQQETTKDDEEEVSTIVRRSCCVVTQISHDTINILS